MTVCMGRAVVAVCLVATASCAPVYIAPAPNAPLLDRAGELQAGLQIGTNGYDLQGAYAIDETFAAVVDISGTNPSSGDNNVHYYGEVGGGLYLPLSESLRFEAFGGVGYGISRGEGPVVTVSTDDAGNTTLEEGTKVDEGSYVRPFLQADVGYESEGFSFAFVLRSAYVRYSYDRRSDETLPDSAWNVMVEPNVVFGFGKRMFKVEVQAGYVRPIFARRAGDDTYVDPKAFPLHMSIGARFDLDWMLELSGIRPGRPSERHDDDDDGYDSDGYDSDRYDGDDGGGDDGWDYYDTDDEIIDTDDGGVIDSDEGYADDPDALDI